MAQATDLHRAFRTPIDASRITDIATDLAKGQTTERAFAEIEADLDILFAKWAALIDGRV